MAGERVLVTGAAGLAGRAVVAELRQHGFKVTGVDRLPTGRPIGDLVVDLCDLGQTFQALRGADHVIHLGAIPRPGYHTDEVTFRNNTLSTFNVFSAAVELGVNRVVWASSETVLGVPMSPASPPAYFPYDEEHPPVSLSGYALSKRLGEEMARHFHALAGTGFVGLRISNIFGPDHYAQVAGWQDDARKRCFNLWGYVDVRDVAQAARLGVTAEGIGAEVCIIAAADTVMARPNHELLAEVFPDVPITGDIGEHDTLLKIDRARRLLGYEPRHSWRDQ